MHPNYLLFILLILFIGLFLFISDLYWVYVLLVATLKSNGPFFVLLYKEGFWCWLGFVMFKERSTTLLYPLFCWNLSFLRKLLFTFSFKDKLFLLYIGFICVWIGFFFFVNSTFLHSSGSLSACICCVSFVDVLVGVWVFCMRMCVS